MKAWLKNLSIAKKLYAVVGLMALLITFEIVTLRFTMSTISAIKVFIEISNQWNTAQKDATINLYHYAYTGDEKYYTEYLNQLRVPKGFKRGRVAMENCPDLDRCPDLYAESVAGFREGKIPPQTIPYFMRTARFLKGWPHMEPSANIWRRGDILFGELERIGEDLRTEINKQAPDREKMASLVNRLGTVNAEYTELQNLFSARMARASRFLERGLMVILIFALFTVGSIALYVIYCLIRYFSLNIEEVKEVAVKVGQGDFTQRIRIRSKDELGQMARGLNRMIEDLQISVGKQVQAESANQVKSLFLANMSHEVRTPLGVILGLLEILKDPSVSAEDRAKYMLVIEQTGRNLQQIINDILDISKVEAGHLDINTSRFSMHEFIEEINLNMQLLAQRGKNRLQFRAVGEIPETVVTDRTRLRQILTNLIGNGLKFTHEGIVAVTYGVKGKVMRFRVEDTGIGIPESERNRLFQAFSQLDQSLNRKYGGTGLGLLLSKRLAQALGGNIELEASRPGEGSTFTVAIPLSEQPATTAVAGLDSKAVDYEKLKGKRVLLVEDSEDNQMLVKLFLSKKEIQVDYANNGQEGIDKATQGQYDLVLMDMQMPVVDGYTATEELRRRGYQIPIIALTAHAMKEDRERCLRVGCNDYMTKPIDPNSFFKTITTHLDT